MSELRMPRIEGQLEITGGPTILRKKTWLWLKKIDHEPQKKIPQINKKLRTNKLEQETPPPPPKKEDLKDTG